MIKAVVEGENYHKFHKLFNFKYIFYYKTLNFVEPLRNLNFQTFKLSMEIINAEQIFEKYCNFYEIFQ